ncbi:MAG: hypothetical protein NWS20_05400 [Rickettsiaceae bacterium]|nr:hypothetical protein [Rickettsiaceae bacterium]MDP4832934.1 hypothetical protein [Rickettsiaceae bacterium]MDP5020751.1 hypothetical protein [Rickettsiaceae bacterium]MDP5083474.1 hypothetical protein [Rickettsiaceae bacterium]
MTDNETLEELQNEIAAIFDNFLEELSDDKAPGKEETIGSN